MYYAEVNSSVVLNGRRIMFICDRNVETLRDIAKNPAARIFVSPDPFGGENTNDNPSLSTSYIGDDNHAG
jgi:hypothetical protein